MADVRGLKRSLGMWSVVAFAVTNQIGAGLFFVTTQVQITAPGVGAAVPWLMLAGGAMIALIVAAYRLLLRDGPAGAGGEYTMLKRSLGKHIAFCATFTSWFGITGAMATLALTAARFLESGASALGLTAFAAALHSPYGTAAFGFALIWSAWVLHVRGVDVASRIAWASGFFVVALALGVAAVLFAVGPDALLAAAAAHVHRSPAEILAAAPPAMPVWQAITTALPILFFSYLGIATATQTGEETRDPGRAVPRGIIIAVAIVTVVYVTFSAAVAHAVPWQLVAGLGALKETSATTTIGLLAFVVPPFVGAALALATAFVVAKTIVPLFLAQSRWVYAWAEDGMIPRWASRIAPRFGTPVTALTIGAVCASLVFLEALAFGFAFGVALRVLSAMLVLALCGVALARQTAGRRALGITLLLLALAFIGSIVTASRTAAFATQPAVQAAIVLAIAVAIVVARRSRESASVTG